MRPSSAVTRRAPAWPSTPRCGPGACAGRSSSPRICSGLRAARRAVWRQTFCLGALAGTGVNVKRWRRARRWPPTRAAPPSSPASGNSAPFGPSACAVPLRVDHVLAGHDNTTSRRGRPRTGCALAKVLFTPSAPCRTSAAPVLSAPAASAARGALVDTSQTRRCSAFAIPAVERRRGQLVYTELAALLSNASLPIVRRARGYPSTSNRTTRAAPARRGPIVMHARLAVDADHGADPRAATRSVATALCFRRPRVLRVVYVSSQHAISGRHVEREPWLIAKLNATATFACSSISSCSCRRSAARQHRAFGGAKYRDRALWLGAAQLPLHGAGRDRDRAPRRARQRLSPRRLLGFRRSSGSITWACGRRAAAES